jgi:hypothetical protein
MKRVATVGRQAPAPDRHHTIDVGLRAGPHFEAGVTRLEVHGQGRPEIVEAGMHLAADRPAMGALDALGREQVCCGRTSAKPRSMT